jgi:Dyp-type peroxidase family
VSPWRSPVELEFGDLQGGILSAYGKRGFPKGRFLLFHIANGAAGRAFVEALRPLVTAALRWPRDGRPPGPGEVAKPECTLNIAFTFWGLLALDVPTRTLRGMPEAFIDGMAVRAPVLGDDIGQNLISGWDDPWIPDPAAGKPRPHVLVMLNAAADHLGKPVAALDQMTTLVLGIAAQMDGLVLLLEGHRGPDPRWQELSAIWGEREDGTQGPLPIEHFGFVDAIGDPVFEGQYPGHEEWDKCRGQGAVDGKGVWRPLRTGEFILGWPDEAQEVAGTGLPLDFSRNGTFFAYRKLHQDLDAWDAWVEDRARGLAQAWGIAEPEVARETLVAKMAGRWRDGVPLSRAPDWASWQEARARLAGMSAKARIDYLTEFDFTDDPSGTKCPVTAHIRRANTRNMLDPWYRSKDRSKKAGSVLNDRRRILRRGLPYGGRKDPHGEHGIVLLAYCADLFRQFEFVQQQWMNYGLDFDAGNDSCPIVGAHGAGARFVVPAPEAGKPPFIAGGLPQFVATRGGDYFFQPSMTSLRMIGQGIVDPT